MEENVITTIIVMAIVAIGLFFVLRGLMLWYYRINDIVNNQQKTNNLLEKMLNYQTTGKIYGEIDGDIIVKHNASGKIQGISQEKWDSLTEKQQSMYTIQKK